ncbi:hypothetical protein N0V83_005704 [Neocucurbitaria cava]|uniref:Uncharacterized protein n=1 Tax=Neocucurbitaria cava TaxID=798079 RepID=A0A9W9CMA2_9PLEO|nr:hypothetical protein N0V83_005704 [Neocucurbitaria cava]
MPPIPIHKDAPIAPTKADGITPQTAPPDPLPPTRTTPAYAPATTTQDSSNNPPAPQPGARPAAPTQNNFDASSPAPPQPGAVPTATVITTETRQLSSGPPPQFTSPPPSDSALRAGRSTTTSTTASKPGPTTLNYGLAGAAPSPFQAADSSAAPAAEPTRSSLEHPPGYVQAPDNAPYTAGGGIGGISGGDGGGGQGSEDAGVGAAAWNMLSKAGEALKKGEEAAWRAMRNK